MTIVNWARSLCRWAKNALDSIPPHPDMVYATLNGSLLFPGTCDFRITEGRLHVSGSMPWITGDMDCDALTSLASSRMRAFMHVTMCGTGTSYIAMGRVLSAAVTDNVEQGARLRYEFAGDILK